MRVNPDAPLLTGDAIRFTIWCLTESQITINLFDYMADIIEPNPRSYFAAAMTSFLTNMSVPFAACITPQTTMFKCVIACMSNATSAPLEATLAVPGTVVDVPLPLPMTAVISKYSNLRGQHGRGRVYMPAVPTLFTDPAVEADRLVAAGTTAYTALGAAYLLTVTGGAVNLDAAVLTRPTPPATLVTRAMYITNCVVQPTLRTQRRRLYGRGI